MSKYLLICSLVVATFALSNGAQSLSTPSTSNVDYSATTDSDVTKLAGRYYLRHRTKHFFKRSTHVRRHRIA
jgi:hypothetical protein